MVETLHTQRDFEPSRSQAILFGVSNYAQDSGYESMEWINHNIKELGDLLKDDRIFGFVDVKVVGDPSWETIAEMLRSISVVNDDLDTILIYYCGHGDVGGGEYYLTGSNSKASDPIYRLNFKVFEDRFLRIPARRRILILDSCFSGRAVSGKLSTGQAIVEAHVGRLSEGAAEREEGVANPRGVFVLASADRDSPAEGMEVSGRFTAFTGALIGRLLKGWPNRKDTLLSLDELAGLLRSDAQRFGIPEPVPVSKFGLGSWRCIGNLAVLSEENRGISAEVLDKTLRELRAELSAQISAISDKVEQIENGMLHSNKDKRYVYLEGKTKWDVFALALDGGVTALARQTIFFTVGILPAVLYFAGVYVGKRPNAMVYLMIPTY